MQVYCFICLNPTKWLSGQSVPRLGFGVLGLERSLSWGGVGEQSYIARTSLMPIGPDLQAAVAKHLQ